MKTKLRIPLIFFLILSIFILSCSLVSPATATPVNSDLPPAGQESQAVVTPEETAASTATSHPGSYAPFGLLMNKDFGPLPNNSDFGLGPLGSEGAGEIGMEVGFSGAVCSLEQAFTLTDPDGDFGVLQFTPSGPGAGSVNISGGWVLARQFGEAIKTEGNYTVEDSQGNANILEGNLGLHITTGADCWGSAELLTLRAPNEGCFPQDSWIYLTPLETTECGQP